MIRSALSLTHPGYMWALKPPLWPVGAESVAPRFGLLESEINWAPSTELSVDGENLKPEGAMVARTFSKDNILVKNPPNL